MPLLRCDQEFVTFNRDKFKTENAYNLDISVTNHRRETRTFKQRFYGYKGTRYHMVLGMEFLKAKGASYYDQNRKRQAYTPQQDKDINVLHLTKFTQELERDPLVTAQVLFLSKGECTCLINYLRY